MATLYEQGAEDKQDLQEEKMTTRIGGIISADLHLIEARYVSARQSGLGRVKSAATALGLYPYCSVVHGFRNHGWNYGEFVATALPKADTGDRRDAAFYGGVKPFIVTELADTDAARSVGLQTRSPSPGRRYNVATPLADVLQRFKMFQSKVENQPWRSVVHGSRGHAFHSESGDRLDLATYLTDELKRVRMITDEELPIWKESISLYLGRNLTLPAGRQDDFYEQILRNIYNDLTREGYPYPTKDDIFPHGRDQAILAVKEGEGMIVFHTSKAQAYLAVEAKLGALHIAQTRSPSPGRRYNVATPLADVLQTGKVGDDSNPIELRTEINSVWGTWKHRFEMLQFRLWYFFGAR
ncbi:MAG: hypothetical protein PHH14_00315 [Candidatus Margulisbacteria bacterium]|nr:hypothetical protein [Candidatus Margulisiibacteriota bacterium]